MQTYQWWWETISSPDSIDNLERKRANQHLHENLCVKQAKVHFAYFVQFDQHGISANIHKLTQRSILK